jgi:hypothetical protein
VKGHQKKNQDQPMTHVGYMHNYADMLCKQAREQPDETRYYPLPANRVNLILNNKTITAHAPKATSVAFHSIALKSYYRNHLGWKTNMTDMIWWKAYSKSTQPFNRPDNLRIQKFINDKMPTNKRISKYYGDRQCLCRSCNIETEDEDHMIRCKTQDRAKIRQEWLEELNQFLSNGHTPSAVKEGIMQNMERWLEPTKETENKQTACRLTNQAVKQQTLSFGGTSLERTYIYKKSNP